MKCHKTKLSNGLRLLTIPMPSSESATVTIWTNVGSRYEPKHIGGISHFFEHIVFKGGQKYSSPKAVSEAIDNFGGEFNASTGKEKTRYYIKAPIAKLDRAFDVLSDIVLTPLMKPADIAMEKGVIKAEIDMYEDTPVRNIYEVYENLIFQGNSLEMDIAGTKASVDNIFQKDFKKFIKDHYHVDNMLITVAGGITPAKSKALAEKYLGSLSKSKKLKPKKFSYQHKKPVTLLKTKKTDQAHLIVGYLGEKYGSKDRYSEAVLASILGGGMSSRIFTEVREKRGLAYAVKTSADGYSDAGDFSTYVGCDTKNAPEAIKTILSEYAKMTNTSSAKVGEREFKKAKEYIKGHLALSLEGSGAVSFFFGYEELILGNTRNIEDVYKRLDQVQVEDVVRVAKKFFRPERLNLAIIGPFKSEEKFKKLLT